MQQSCGKNTHALNETNAAFCYIPNVIIET